MTHWSVFRGYLLSDCMGLGNVWCLLVSSKAFYRANGCGFPRLSPLKSLILEPLAISYLLHYNRRTAGSWMPQPRKTGDVSGERVGMGKNDAESFPPHTRPIP